MHDKENTTCRRTSFVKMETSVPAETFVNT